MSPEEVPEKDDFDRIVACLNKHKVKYMIIGGFAVVYHGYVRDTQDIDFFIRSTEENAKRAVAALEQAGFACPELTPKVFTSDNGISLGEPPVKVDILSRLPGVSFDAAWARRETSYFGPETASYISLEDLIENKRAVGRKQDLADVEKLEIARESLCAKDQGKEKEKGRSNDRNFGP